MKQASPFLDQSSNKKDEENKMADIATLDLLTTLMTFAVSIFFSSLAVDRKSYTCSYLAAMSWFIFSIIFIVDSAFGSLMILFWMWLGFFFIFLLNGVVLSFQAWNIMRARKDEEVTF